MSAYEPNSRHLREVLIFCFNMKNSAAEWMTVYFWEPGLINSPQSHIMMSLMQNLTSLVFTVCGVTCRRLAVAMESGRRGLEMTTWS
ncbi:hypothetical protein TNCV_1927071 [Trichonephila clavipes]|nr:hypothetical protein TNCV_1927071 [Trichonephila clavipes]